MNAAGCGRLIIPVRLESGEELPFILDTGSPVTLVDKSLRPRLGKASDSITLRLWDRKERSKLYPAPKLYLGQMLLQTGTHVATCDFQKFPGVKQHPVMGIIGVDALKNYCVQADFGAGRIRFAEKPGESAGWPGERFEIVLSDIGQSSSDFFRTFIRHQPFGAGASTNLLMIDTGLDLDGAFGPKLLAESDSNRFEKVSEKKWIARESSWCGGTYTNLVVQDASGADVGAENNLLGLRFLSRHLVTLDFSNSTLYLQQQSVGPLENEYSQAMESLVIGGTDVPVDLGKKVTLVIDHQSAPFWFRFMGGTLTFKKFGDSVSYHYRVRRKHKGERLWTVTRAWSTDARGRKLKDFRIPSSTGAPHS